MTDITAIIENIRSGYAEASDQLLPVVYDELRRLAASKMNTEREDHTLTPTALVHEVYIKLVKNVDLNTWNGRDHFFNAAAEAMRRILIDHARTKKAQKRGGAAAKIEYNDEIYFDDEKTTDLLELNDALEKLESKDSDAANLVKLRFFAGLTNQQAADTLKMSPRKANMLWSFARAWLKKEISSES